ncbi:MAG: tRNA (adenosine(37)-N6)-dimethylallyltransferase MiaA [Thermoleophilia bacterium]|nr:tRNA (adenosine(37)-N6)-dimethylallyltransferase MiaA [Thermoleophilia bacterium]
MNRCGTGGCGTGGCENGGPEAGGRGVAGHKAGVAPRVIGVLGPTGVGKTAVGVELARLLGVRIISCDSMQVYRGFPVLTNQPSAEESAAVRDTPPGRDAPEVRHELVACVEPGEPFSAVEYARLARPLIEEDLVGTGHALLVGGTGLYMRAALAPLAAPVEGDPDLRTRLEARAAAEGGGALHDELARLDPEAARSIDPRNVRRVIRALEAVSLTGRAWSGRDDLWTPVYDHPTTVLGLVMERAELYRRIDARVAAIVTGGALEEVRRFRESAGVRASSAGVTPAATHGGATPGGPGIRSAIGYQELCSYLDGAQSLEDTIALIAAATRQYARRQLTWLRKLRDAVIIDIQGRDPRGVAQEIADLVSR